MGVHGERDRPRISSTEGQHQRDAALPRGPGDDSIAGAKPVQGEHQAPEEIVLERIHAGLEEEDVGPRLLQHSGEVALQHLNIFRIATAIGQRDVQ